MRTEEEHNVIRTYLVGQLQAQAVHSVFALGVACPETLRQVQLLS